MGKIALVVLASWNTRRNVIGDCHLLANSISVNGREGGPEAYVVLL